MLMQAQVVRFVCYMTWSVCFWHHGCCFEFLTIRFCINSVLLSLTVFFAIIYKPPCIVSVGCLHILRIILLMHLTAHAASIFTMWVLGAVVQALSRKVQSATRCPFPDSEEECAWSKCTYLEFLCCVIGFCHTGTISRCVDLFVCILCVFVSYCIVVVLLWAQWGGPGGIEA